MEGFTEEIQPITSQMNQTNQGSRIGLQFGGAKTGIRSQVKPVGTYMYDKLMELFKYDEKTAYNLIENVEYIFLTVIVCYLYSNIINNLLPYKKSFSKEKKALDLALHIVALTIGFFLLPKLIQIVPSIMHGSTSFTAYESNGYSGLFVPLFLVSFNMNAIYKKIGGVSRDTITVKILRDNEKKDVKVVDENLRPKQQSRTQVLKTPDQKYPTTSNIPSVLPLNRQQIEGTAMSGFERPKQTRTPDLKDGNDIRNFLSQVQNSPSQQHGDMSSIENDPAEMERRALRPPQQGQYQQAQEHPILGSMDSSMMGGGSGLGYSPF
jgi:hypothetical protein